MNRHSEKTALTTSSVILNILGTYWYMTLLLAAAAAGSVAASLVPPRIMQHLIDSYLSAGKTAVTPAFSACIIRIAAAYFASFAAIAVLEIIREAVLSAAGQKIAAELRSAMMRKASRIPSAYYTSHESGAIVSRFTNDIEEVQSLFTNGIISMIIDMLKVIGIVVSMWLFSPILGMFTLCLLPVLYFITRFFQKRMLGAQKKKRGIVARITGFVPETVRNIRMIHAFGKESYMERKYAECISDGYDTIEKINLYDSVYSPVIKILSALTVAATAVIAAAHLPFALITAGVAAASIQYITDIFEPVSSLGMELESIQSAIAGISRIDEYFAEPEDPAKDQNKAAVLFQQLRTDRHVTIELSHVTFSYGAALPKILDDVSLVIRPEERITFAGRTGAGKSTLFNIIPGLLVPQSGCVLINGIDAAELPNTCKRRLFGYVTQHFDFIDGSVADQITMGDSSIPRADIERALEFTGMYEYVASLPSGMDTPARPDMFSQGQLQLLAVSRAVAARPPVLLLDEITANLDSATEKQLTDVLNKAGDGCTVLSISHRLSAQIACSRIITVEDGKLR